MNPPGRTEFLKAQRDARMEARAEKRRQVAQRLRDARFSVEELAKRMPEGCQTWDVAHRSAYIAMLKTVQRKAHNVGMTAARLESMLDVLHSAPQWSLPYCRHLTGLRANSLNIEAPGCTEMSQSGSVFGSVDSPGTAIYCRYGSAEQLASTQNRGQPGHKHPLARAADALQANSGDPQRHIPSTS